MKKEIKVITDLSEIDEDAIAEGFYHPLTKPKPVEPKPEPKKKKAKKEKKVG